MAKTPIRERRAHKRFPIICPITVSDGAGRTLLESKTVDLSDGGVRLGVPKPPNIPLGEGVRARFRVPRATPNTFMLEEFVSAASLVRRHAEPAQPPAIALKFHRPLNLELEV